jgi:hypothetical protein
MKILLQLVSLVGLLLTIVPSLLYFTEVISKPNHQWLMFAGTILWFATAPFWMNKR